MSRSCKPFVAAAFAAALIAIPAASSAWVPETIDFVGGEAITARWAPDAFPLVFQVTPGLTDDLAPGVARAALDRAMATWSSAPDSNVSMSVSREREVEANVFDGVNAIEFSNDSDLQAAGFVAATFLTTAPDGTILEADILVNDRSIGFADDPGSTVGLDLETAMLRELGRALGLAASPIGSFESDGTIAVESTVMYPSARGVGETARTLAPDDIAAVAALYPSASSSRGSISGTVQRVATGGVFAAHVVAFDPVRQILVGAVSLPDGSFEIGGLPPGRYFLEALPLTNPTPPASLGGIFTSDLVETDFRRMFLDRTLRLDAGGAITGVTLEVQ